MEKLKLNPKNAVSKLMLLMWAVIIALSLNSCKDDNDEDQGGGGGGGGGNSGVALSIALEQGAKDDEIIIKCTPAMPAAGRLIPIHTFIAATDFYNYTKTGGDAGSTIVLNLAGSAGWNTAGTEYTYAFAATGGKWDGTVTLKPIDPLLVKQIGGTIGVRSVTIGKNNPVPLKLGKEEDPGGGGDPGEGIPGLGDTPGNLSGTPFTLPAGVELAGEITGAGDSEGYWDIDWDIFGTSASSSLESKGKIEKRAFAPSKSAKSGTIHYFGSGTGLVDLLIPLRNVSANPVTVTIPAATIFVSKTGTYQNGVLLKKVTFTIPANSNYNLSLTLYCGNLSRSAAGESAEYSLGVVSDAQPLLDLCNRVKNKKINIEEYTPSISNYLAYLMMTYNLQSIVWNITDEDGLTPEDITYINSLPNSQ